MTAVVAERSAEVTRTRIPRDLRVLMVVVAYVAIASVDGVRPWAYGDLPEGLRNEVPGTGLVELFPLSASAMHVGRWALLGACLVLATGRFHRLAAGAGVVLTFWLLGVPQLFGVTSHTHLVVWLLAIIAAMPARAPESEWRFWRVAVLACVGAVYLFPGLAKAAELPGFVTSDYLHSLIVANRAGAGWTAGFVPPEWLAHWMAAGAIAFEVGYVMAVFTRWRRWAIAAAIVFHLMTLATMGIGFQTLILVNLALLAMPPVGTTTLPRALPATVVAVGVVAMAFAVGIAGKGDAWPFARYPTFAYTSPDYQRRLMFATIDGERYRVGELIVPEAPPASWIKFEQHTGTALIEEVERRYPEAEDVGFVLVD